MPSSESCLIQTPMRSHEERRSCLRDRVEYWAHKLRVRPRVVRVQQMTRKWGSCSTAGIVTLAIDLADQEPAFRDFVIAHELLHLRVPNHGKLFKALMTLHVPGWRKYDVGRRPPTIAGSVRSRHQERLNPIVPQTVDDSRRMTEHGYKKPGLLRAGFQYQDLVAIEILIEFYRQRDLYAWVQLEAEQQEFRSIEDVVACRPDGRYELTQVKFTADPNALSNTLSWEWLTANGGARKKSLLQKWAQTTLHHKEARTLASAALKTDRIPDADFARCLKETTVDYSLIPAQAKGKVDEQLGSAQAAQSFFQSFYFVHSQPILDDLEDRLWSKIASDTNRAGFALFREQVQRWSTRKEQPAPDGRIKHIHLRQALSVERSRPIPQDFLLPPTYSVPDADFDRAFLAEITSSSGPTVLWGPPGRGKSTYLSHCVASLNQETAVCIRHHYFLSLEDRSQGRFHYYAIAQSLRHQLDQALPDLGRSSSELGEYLEVAACRLKEEGRQLIVIVDGLDHVWRDHRDHEDMETLFDALLPLPDNVRLVVGTQKISSEHLPTSLLNALPPEQWTELPLMSQVAVYRWIRSQDKAGRLNLRLTAGQRRPHVIRTIAGAFYDISQGLPLHLIYSFEALARTGAEVTPEDVAALPACPSGDIRSYYRSFWTRTDAKARTILHVLAGLEFGPPPFAIYDCFGRCNQSLISLAEINHLLDYRETEIRPFHGSLFAFVRDLPEHKVAFATHAPDVLAWLEVYAPEYWRWAWLWITKAQLGDSSDLLTGPNRDWAIRSLVAGFPIEQLVSILDHAEKAAFDAFNLPRLLALRLLKTRAVNGPEFQTDQWPLLQEIALSLSSDPYALPNLRSRLHRAPAELLPFLVRTADDANRAEIAQSAIRELNGRIDRLLADETSSGERQADLVNAIVAVAGTVRRPDTPRFLRSPRSGGTSDALIGTYARTSVLTLNFENVFKASKHRAGHNLDREVLAALCLEGLAPSIKPDLKALTHPALRCLTILKGGRAKRSRTRRNLSSLFPTVEGSGPRYREDVHAVAYNVFFAALASGLSGRSARGWSKMPSEAETTWFGDAIRSLERLAEAIAQRWTESGRWPPMREVYGLLDLREPPMKDHDVRLCLTGTRLALRDITVDLCTIGRGLDPTARIGVEDIESASQSPFWLDDLWIDCFNERRLPLHTPEAAQALVERVERHLDSTITEFNERTATAAKLAIFALDHNLPILAEKELRRGVGCLLGYGWRKDLFALEVVKSLDLLARKGDSKISQNLLSLAGEFEAITEYTDGDETDFARETYLKTVARHFPERVPTCFAHLIHAEDWRFAEVLSISMLKASEVGDPLAQALFETYIGSSEIQALQAASRVEPHSTAALSAVLKRTGRTSVRTEARPGEALNSSDDSESPEPDTAVPDPGKFTPSRLGEYLAAIREVRPYDHGRSLVTDWLRYWDAKGQGEEALADLEATTSPTEAHLDLDDAFDVAFGIALRIQGRSRAYQWLIRAHVTRSGWQRWWTSDKEARARFKVFSAHYREKWQDFITATARPVFSTRIEGNGIIVGFSRLTCFLTEVGEFDLARACSLEMAAAFQQEVAEQPIEAPKWSK